MQAAGLDPAPEPATAVVLGNAEAVVSYAGPSTFDVLGYTSEELYGWSVFDLIHPDDAAAARRTHTRALECPGEPMPATLRIRQKNGAWRSMEAFITSLVHIDSVPVVVVQLRDITDHHRAEAELWNSRERLELVLSALDVGFWYCDLPLDRLVWNVKCKEHFGLPPDAEVSLEAFYEHVHPDDRERARQAIEQSIATGAGYDVDCRTAGLDGGERWIRAIGRVFPDAEGRPGRFDGITLDVSEQKRSELAIGQTQKLESLGVLAGGVAHDFNNLLVGVLGNASMVMEGMAASHPDRRLLEEVVRAAERAAGLTRQLLAYAGRARFVIQPVDLSEMVGEISALIRASIPKTVDLRLELPGGLPSLDADAGQLQQLIMNLIINGAEAIGGDRPGTVLVTTGVQSVEETPPGAVSLPGEIPPGKYVYLQVQDSGVGMDEDTKARIFDPFFTTKETGRGLGLAAALGIVRSHKGSIRVYSSPGQGSIFKVLLPAGHGARPVAELEGGSLFGTGLILVVDDEETVRRTAKAALQHYGYSVLLVEDGRAAVELFRHMPDRIAAVLLDLGMPVMGGEEAFRQMTSIRPDLPVVLSSGYSESEATLRLPHGAAAFLQKPYSAERLAEKIKSALAGRAGAGM